MPLLGKENEFIVEAYGEEDAWEVTLNTIENELEVPTDALNMKDASFEVLENEEDDFEFEPLPKDGDEIPELKNDEYYFQLRINEDQ
ncbi:MAG: hypothetical protein AAF316_00230 [Cyanobacteria bacterium P01_A01_bin.80]